MPASLPGEPDQVGAFPPREPHNTQTTGVREHIFSPLPGVNSVASSSMGVPRRKKFFACLRDYLRKIDIHFPKFLISYLLLMDYGFIKFSFKDNLYLTNRDSKNYGGARFLGNGEAGKEQKNPLFNHFFSAGKLLLPQCQRTVTKTGISDRKWKEAQRHTSLSEAHDIELLNRPKYTYPKRLRKPVFSDRSHFLSTESDEALSHTAKDD